MLFYKNVEFRVSKLQTHFFKDYAFLVATFFLYRFSTSVELQPDKYVCVHVCVCVCVSAPQPLGRSIEGVNGQTCLKFGTLKGWVNP